MRLASPIPTHILATKRWLKDFVNPHNAVIKLQVAIPVPIITRRFAWSARRPRGRPAIEKKIAKDSKEINFNNIVSNGGKIIVYMGVSQIQLISEKLINEGMKKNTRVTIISNSSLNNECIYKTNLKEVPKVVNKSGVRPPSIIIIN